MENLIRVLDDTLPEALLASLAMVQQQPVQYGWRSHHDLGHGHFNWTYAGVGMRDREDVTDLLVGPVKSIWEHIAREWLPAFRPMRAYVNGHVYGTEGYPHTDSQYPEDRTAMLYLNPEWKREWAGETVFFHGDEAVRAVMPRYGRGVIFPATVPHVARSVSRICPVMRTCLVFKCRPA